MVTVEEFHPSSDCLKFGVDLSLEWIAKETREDGLLYSLIHSSIYEGLMVQRASHTIEFKIGQIEDIENQAYHILERHPHSFTPQVIAKIVGAMILDQTVVIHSASRAVIFDLSIFVLSLICPLRWPFPIVPLISTHQFKEILASPFPILCGIEEDPEDFIKMWGEVSKKTPSMVHIQLETGNSLGMSTPDFKEDIMKSEHSFNWDNCKKLYKRLIDPKKDFLPEHTKVDLLFCFRSALRRVFFDCLDDRILKLDPFSTFNETIEVIRQRSSIPPKVLDAYLSSQVFQAYLQAKQRE